VQDETPVRRVAKRTVFYIEGYDPRGPGHYHRLYLEEAARQSPVNGLDLKVGARRRISPIESAWSVASPTTEVQYHFLRYDDLMRTRWSKTNFAVLGDILYYCWAYLTRGVFLRTLKVSWPAFVTMMLAPGIVLAAVLLALLAAAIAGLAAGWLVAMAVGAVVFVGLVMLRGVLESRFAAFWVARILAFTSDQGGGRAKDMDARLDEFAARIAAAVEDGSADEMLIVGHSVGAHNAVSAVARALNLCSSNSGALSLLTLGHNIPMLGWQPGATRFRKELAQVAADPRVAWIDVSASIDGACFPLTDPLWGSGLAQPDPSAPKPKLLSARFHTLFRPETYASLKRDFRRSHFQYLMAAELPGDYDYFLITAGDQTLDARYSHLDSVTGFDRFRFGKP